MRVGGLQEQHRRGQGATAGEVAVGRLLSSCRLWTAATSFGGVHSTLDRRAQWGGDEVPPGFVRLSCGVEDTADLVTDLARALEGLDAVG